MNKIINFKDCKKELIYLDYETIEDCYKYDFEYGVDYDDEIEYENNLVLLFKDDDFLSINNDYFEGLINELNYILNSQDYWNLELTYIEFLNKLKNVRNKNDLYNIFYR